MPLRRPKTGPDRTDCARPDSKHHIVTDATGTLAAILTGANVHDVTQLLPLIDAIPLIRGLRAPSDVPNMAAALANIAGALNARMPGRITFAVSVFVSSAVLTFTAHSSNSAAAGSDGIPSGAPSSHFDAISYETQTKIFGEDFPSSFKDDIVGAIFSINTLLLYSRHPILVWRYRVATLKLLIFVD